MRDIRSRPRLMTCQGEGAPGPPTLTRRSLLSGLKKKGFPPELAMVAIREIIEVMAQAIIRGQPVIFRGFGSFKLRRYQSSTKSLGLIFRPSRQLVGRLNPKLTKNKTPFEG